MIGTIKYPYYRATGKPTNFQTEQTYLSDYPLFSSEYHREKQESLISDNFTQIPRLKNGTISYAKYPLKTNCYCISENLDYCGKSDLLKGFIPKFDLEWVSDTLNCQSLIENALGTNSISEDDKEFLTHFGFKFELTANDYDRQLKKKWNINRYSDCLTDKDPLTEQDKKYILKICGSGQIEKIKAFLKVNYRKPFIDYTWNEIIYALKQAHHNLYKKNIIFNQGNSVNIGNQINKNVGTVMNADTINCGLDADGIKTVIAGIRALQDSEKERLKSYYNQLQGSEENLDKRSSISDKIKKFLVNSGIAAAQSLTTQGIVAVCSALFGG